jgi:GNAT superfamily N-acetyltransferase
MRDNESGSTRIEQASQVDAHTLVTLGMRVHRLHVSRASRFFLQPSDAQMEAALLGLLARENARAFIAYRDDVPVTYVLVLIHEQPANPLVPARRWLYVYQLSVEPQWERHGIGRQLMQRAIDFGRDAGIDELVADVWAFNEEAQAFFKACGCRPQIERFWMHLGK